MPKEIDNFSVCDEIWNQVKQTVKLRNQVENIRLWFQADKEPDLDVIKQTDHVVDVINQLYQWLIDLHAKLLTSL